MISRNGRSLEIFENFKAIKEPSTNVTIGDGIYRVSDRDSLFIQPAFNPIDEKLPWYTRLWVWFLSLFIRKPISIAEFFSEINNSKKELQVIEERAAGYAAAINKAKANKQSALVEQLLAGLRAYKKETQLVAIGMTTFVLEQDVVLFTKRSKRGLRLDWIKHFTRQIPDEVLEEKEKADKLSIFDNYVVLHFDPEDKGNAKTEAERKDPILFGVIEGKRRLYFVDDWVDEYCDLTLDQIADELGSKAVKELQ